MRKNIYLSLIYILLSVAHLNAQVTLLIPDLNASCGEEITVPVNVTGFTDVATLSFSINWDTTVFEFVPNSAVSFTNGVLFNQTAAATENGLLGFLFLNIEGETTLAPGTTLMEFKLKTVGTVESSMIGYGNEPIEMVNVNNNAGAAMAINITNPCPIINQSVQLSCPVTQPVTAISEQASVAITDLTPIVSDNADLSTLNYTLSKEGSTIGGNSGDASGETFTVGITTLTYTISDGMGNATSCTTTITVNPPVSNNTTLTLLASSGTTNCQDDQICVIITTANFTELSDMQFSINWDPTLLEYVSVENNNDALNSFGVLYGAGQTESGILNFAWSDVEGDGHTLDDGVELFQLCFRPIGNGVSPIAFTNNRTPIKINRYIDPTTDEEITDYSFLSGTITVDGCSTIGNGSTDFALTIDDIATTCIVDEVCVQVSADNFTSLSDMQFSLNWDISLLEFVSLTNNDNALIPDFGVVYGESQTNNGILNVAWSDVEGDGHTLMNGTTLFEICFKPLSNGLATIAFTDNLTPIKVSRYINNTTEIQIDNPVLNAGVVAVSNCDTTTGSTNDTFSLEIGNNNVSCGEDQVCVGITTANFESLSDLQFSVNWDSNLMGLVSLTNNDDVLDPDFGVLYGTNETENGILNFAWSDMEGNGHTIADGVELFQLCFRPINNGVSPIAITNNQTPIKINRYISPTTDEEVTDFTFEDGAITVSDCTVNSTNFTLYMDDLEQDCDQTGNMCVNIRANNFTSLSDVQFSINWDQANLKFNSLDNNDDALIPDFGVLYGVNQTDSGILNFAWSDVEGDGHTLSNGTRLFTLCFELVGPGSNEIQFTNNLTPIKVTEYVNEIRDDPVTDFQFLTGTLSFLDNVPPTVGNCPTEPVVLYTSENSCQAVGTWTEPIFIDDCSFVTTQQTFTPGAVFDLGDQLVQYTGIDASANIAECIFMVSVRDTIAPTVITCPPSTFKDLSAATTCDPTVTWDPPVVSDICTDNTSLIISSTFQPGDAFPMGVSTVRYTILDSSGNINNDCAFTVDLRGEAPLRLTDCPENIPVSFSAEGGCDLSVTWTPPGLINGCGIGNVDFVSNFDPGDQFPVGTTMVTYTASDEGGNTASCSFEVTITGASGLNFNNCPSNITVDSQLDLCGANIGWDAPTATGGCGVPTTVQNFRPLDFFPVGTTTVEYTATDDAGQVSRCNFTVSVIDAQSLIVRCPTNVRVGADGTVVEDAGNFIRSIALDNCESYRIEYNDIEAVDNCSATINRTIVRGLASNSLFDIGMNELEIQVSNDSGESRNCEIRIDIDEPMPVVAGISSNVVCVGQEVRLEATTIPGAIYTWSGPSGFTSNAQNPIINSPTLMNSGEYTVSAAMPGGCEETSTITVVVNPSAMVEATASDLECGGGQIELMATAEGMPIETWEWRGPNSYTSDEQNPIINNAVSLQAGSYVVRATATNGCVASAIVDVAVNSIAPPTVTASGLFSPGVACVEQAIDLKGNIYQGDVTYSWTASDAGAGIPADTNDSLIVAVPTAAGSYTYTYTVDLGNGCVADTSITIEVMPSPSINLESNGPFTCATADQRIELNATNVGIDQDVTYLWEGPMDFTATAPSPFITDISGRGGDYVLTTTSSNGCIATDTINVPVTAKPASPILSSERVIVCEGEDLIFEVNPITGFTYNWSGPNDFISTDSMVVISNALVENGGGYQVIASDNGCDSEPAILSAAILTDPELNNDEIDNLYNESMEFEVISNDTLVPGAGFTIRLPDAVSGLVENEAGTLQNNGDGSFLFTPVRDWIGKVQVAYEICYEDCPELCSMAVVTIDTDVSSEECFIPGVLSPNGDDKNDALIISCNPEPAKGGGIMIFNQWGSKVYESFPYNNDWNGLYKGEELPDGVYYFIYKQTDDDQDPKKGCVTIFR